MCCSLLQCVARPHTSLQSLPTSYSSNLTPSLYAGPRAAYVPAEPSQEYEGAPMDPSEEDLGRLLLARPSRAPLVCLLQPVAACCSLLQSVAAYCRLLQSAAFCCSLLQSAAVCCSLLRCVAVCCGLLQFVAVCCSLFQPVAVCCSLLRCVAVCCGVLQSAAADCSLLQSAAVCCSLLQFVAVCCSQRQCSAVKDPYTSHLSKRAPHKHTLPRSLSLSHTHSFSHTPGAWRADARRNGQALRVGRDV